MEILTCKIKEYIQPFERRLALLELRALTRAPIIPIDGDEETALTFSIDTSSDVETLRKELTYWRSVGGESDGLTVQLRSEATSLITRNWVNTYALEKSVRSTVPPHLPNKRCLRYATHGLHEYRGKFFPQLVRSLMNVAGLDNNAILLDPMCGSGTTLVEAMLSGRKAYGLDMNPLSVFISDVKCAALTLQPSELVTAYNALEEWLNTYSNYVEGVPTHLSEDDQAYLKRWFASQTLKELNCIESAIRRLSTPLIQKFYLVCLSNILRKVSWQNNADLRVRREVINLESGETVECFLKEALRSTRVVASFLAERDSNFPRGEVVVQQADARRALNVFPNLVNKVDAVITSPPYATALPYIDTDRLSLIYLGLLPRDGHRSLDIQMIGNRELTTGNHTEYWTTYEKHKTLLPSSTQYLIERIDILNRSNKVGFRRRNLAALLSKYFFDMREAIQQSYTLLKPGGKTFLVVGNNRTTAGDEQIEICTADHLGKISENLGFNLVDRLSMEMLVSRDIFKKNAMPSEQIIWLEKPQ